MKAADAQFFLVWGMCVVWSGRGAPTRWSEAALWRELFVLLDLCGNGS